LGLLLIYFGLGFGLKGALRKVDRGQGVGLKIQNRIVEVIVLKTFPYKNVSGLLDLPHLLIAKQLNLPA
jgi:hypothetical protein